MQDGPYWLVISLDRPYSGIETGPDGTIRVPFATRESAERAEGGIMTRTEYRPDVIQGAIVALELDAGSTEVTR